MKNIYILNGPNLNLLGKRQPEIYGSETLDDVEKICSQVCGEQFEIKLLQSNHEVHLIDVIQQERDTTAGIINNPVSFTHTSIAILDALNNYDGSVVEIHISQVHKREEFRHHSYISYRADAVIAGLGIEGYAAAVRYICNL